MVVQTKNKDLKRMRKCVEFRRLNKYTTIDPFPTPFANEIINEVARHNCYPFIDGFFGYNQVAIDK
jgi:hypothetical protein